VSRVNYFPNREGNPSPTPVNHGGFQTYAEKMDGLKERLRGPKFADHFSQATLFYKSLTPIEQDHLVQAAVFELSHTIESIQQAQLKHFVLVDLDLSNRIADGLGLERPVPPHDWVYPKLHSKFLSMEQGPYVVHSPASKKVAVLIGDGFEDSQLNALLDGLKAAQALSVIVGTHSGSVKSVKGQLVKTEFSIFTSKSTLFDAVFIVGGAESVQTLSTKGEAILFVNESFKHFKPIGASGEATHFLSTTPILPGVKFSHGDEVVESLGVVTGAGAKVGGVVAKFIEALAQRRFWTRDVSTVPA